MNGYVFISVENYTDLVRHCN